MATQCYATGRLDDALHYAEAGLAIVDNGSFDPLPYEAEVLRGGVYLSHGRPE